MQNIEIKVEGVTVFQTAESETTYNNVKIRDAEDAIPYLDFIRRRNQEHFVVITLNGANEVIEARIITTGLLDCNQVHPREVFRPAIKDGAAAVLLSHNHPSGTLESSPEDIAITKRLVKAGDIIGIRVLDHVIVANNGWISMKRRGEM